MNRRQKKKRLKIKNKKLYERYPFLVMRDYQGNPRKPDYEYHMFTGFRGWETFLYLMYEELREALIKHNQLNDFYFLDVKEKFGQLRMYSTYSHQDVYDVLHKYEFISGFICMECGSPMATIVDHYGWYLPICEKCWNKENKEREKRGCKTKSYKEVVDERFDEGNLELPDSYQISRYANGEYEEITVDISDTTKKIKERYQKRMRKRSA